MDADEPTVRPVRQHCRSCAGAKRKRSVERAEAPELAANVELACWGGKGRCSDADVGIEDAASVAKERCAQLARGRLRAASARTSSLRERSSAPSRSHSGGAQARVRLSRAFSRRPSRSPPQGRHSWCAQASEVRATRSHARSASAASRTKTGRPTVVQREAAPSPARPSGFGIEKAGRLGAGKGASPCTAAAVGDDVRRAPTTATVKTATATATSAIRMGPCNGPTVSL